MFINKNVTGTKGAILLDVIVSLFIFTLGLTGSLSLIVSAINANLTSQNRLIAVNLAQEGLESFRSMRDTNWLTYSSDLRECWNFWEDTDENGVIDENDSNCNTSGGQNTHPFNPQDSDGDGVLDKYIIDFDSDTFRWKLIPESIFSTLTGDNEGNGTNTTPNYTNGFQLYNTEISGSTFYTHNKYSSATKSPFSRSISLYYIDASDFDDSSDPIIGGTFPSGDTSRDNRILLVSRVWWTQQGYERNIVLSTILTDFLGRTEWNS